MTNINWEQVYQLAKQHSIEDFLKSVTSLSNQELPSVQKFASYMDKYEKKVLPALLQQTNTISPAKFVQIVINEVKKNEKKKTLPVRRS